MPSMELAEAYNAGMSIREENFKTRTQESSDIYFIVSRQHSNQNTKQKSASHFASVVLERPQTAQRKIAAQYMTRVMLEGKGTL